MARLAADSPGYRFALIDKNTGKPTAQGFDLDSVTTIIKAVTSGAFGAAAYYGYRLGIAASMDAEAHDAESVMAEYERLKKHPYAPNRVRDKAGTRGTEAHDLLEALAKGETDAEYVRAEHLDELDGYQRAVLSWWEKEGTKHVWDSEQVVWSLYHRYCGTFDLLDVCCGNVICDLKTSKPATIKRPGRTEHFLQGDAYRLARTEMTGEKHSERLRVYVAMPDGRMLTDDREVPNGVFLDVLNLYRSMEEVEAAG